MTIWINVTTSVGWKWPPVGIVRVEQSIARVLREALGEERVRYCVWKVTRGDFVEIPTLSSGTYSTQPSTSDGSQDRGPSYSLEHQVTPGQFGVSLGTGIREKLWFFARSLPCLAVGVRRLASVRRNMRRIFGKWAFLTRMELGRRWSTSEEYVSRVLRPGDVLVTLAIDWYTGFILQELKNYIGIRIIGCCHDLVSIKYPQYCHPYVAEQFPEYLVQLTRACDAIACYSECTLRDLRGEAERLGLPLPRLFTIRLGVDLPAGIGRPSAVVSSLTERPYILFVSTIERRKNHEILYRAFHRLAEIHGRERLPRMVFVGIPGWGVDDLLEEIKLDPVTRGIIFQLHKVMDDDLRVLYQKSLFCVFPSLYEGWGLPVAEALGFGKPVICSDRGALPEVGSDLVEYLDPWDLPAWVRTIERLWLDEDHRRRLTDRIAREYRTEDWSAAGTEIGRVALGLEGGSPA